MPDVVMSFLFMFLFLLLFHITLCLLENMLSLGQIDENKG